jgi:hypothetical protein
VDGRHFRGWREVCQQGGERDGSLGERAGLSLPPETHPHKTRPYESGLTVFVKHLEAVAIVFLCVGVDRALKFYLFFVGEGTNPSLVKVTKIVATFRCLRGKAGGGEIGHRGRVRDGKGLVLQKVVTGESREREEGDRAGLARWDVVEGKEVRKGEAASAHTLGTVH